MYKNRFQRLVFRFLVNQKKNTLFFLNTRDRDWKRPYVLKKKHTLVAVSVLPVFITVVNTKNNLPYCAYYLIKIKMFFIMAFKSSTMIVQEVLFTISIKKSTIHTTTLTFLCFSIFYTIYFHNKIKLTCEYILKFLPF